MGLFTKDIVTFEDLFLHQLQDVYYAEFNWDTVIEISVMNKINFKAIPKTQYARRDFSLLLDNGIQFAQI